MSQTHDQKCEDPGSDVRECRCEVRALEAKLMLVSLDYEATKNSAADHFRDAKAAEAKLAALKPLVRAAVEWAFVHRGGGTGVIVHQIDALTSESLNLTPAQREWAMGDGGPTREWLEKHDDDGNVTACNPDLYRKLEDK